jgi:SAM-dependent methyltransferase
VPFNLDDAASPRWEERAEAAVRLLAAHLDDIRGDSSSALRIADFGAGGERLRRLLAARLSAPYTYSGFDIHPQTATVVELDVTRELPLETFDVVFCLGLLEYVAPLEPFLARLRANYPSLVISYTLFDVPHPLTARERRKRGWLTDYTQAELERQFAGAGLAVRDFRRTNQARTGVWLLAPRQKGSVPISPTRGDSGPYVDD